MLSTTCAWNAKRNKTIIWLIIFYTAPPSTEREWTVKIVCVCNFVSIFNFDRTKRKKKPVRIVVSSRPNNNSRSKKVKNKFFCFGFRLSTDAPRTRLRIQCAPNVHRSRATNEYERQKRTTAQLSNNKKMYNENGSQAYNIKLVKLKLSQSEKLKTIFSLRFLSVQGEKYLLVAENCDERRRCTVDGNETKWSTHTLYFVFCFSFGKQCRACRGM